MRTQGRDNRKDRALVIYRKKRGIKGEKWLRGAVHWWRKVGWKEGKKAEVKRGRSTDWEKEEGRKEIKEEGRCTDGR